MNNINIFPYRNPDEERNRLIETSCYIDIINHYGFGGAKNFNSNFRILVVGGRTGDDLIFIAEQMKHCDVNIVFHETNQHQLNIAKVRSRIRNLDNIKFINDFTDLTKSKQKFDLIICKNLLNVVNDARNLLNILNKLLDKDGIINIAVPAKFALDGIKMMRDMMDIIKKYESEVTRLIEICKLLLHTLPQNHPIQHSHQKIIKDFFNNQDSAYYYYYINDCNNFYSLKDINALVKDNGLNIIEFINENLDIKKQLDLFSYVDHRKLTYIADELIDLVEHKYVAELINDDIISYDFFCAPNLVSGPSLDNHNNIIFISAFAKKYNFDQILRCCLDMSSQMIVIPHPKSSIKKIFQFKNSIINKIIIEHVLKESLIKDILVALQKKCNFDIKSAKCELHAFYKMFNDYNLFLLKSNEINDLYRYADIILNKDVVLLT